MLEQQQENILVQFFQHAHHRVEGWLMDFQGSLEQGPLDQEPDRIRRAYFEGFLELFERAVEALRQHMYVEEEVVFPLVEDDLAAPIADLRDDHGRIWDLVGELKALLLQGAEMSRVQTYTSRLMNLLASHSAKEDLGVYPDLVALLGVERTLALLQEADRAEAPPEWICASRRAPV